MKNRYFTDSAFLLMVFTYLIIGSPLILSIIFSILGA
jgi:hypothetical protein